MKRQNTGRQTPFRWHSNRKWYRFDFGYTTNPAQGWQGQGTANLKARSAPSHCPRSEPGPLKVLMPYYSSIRNLLGITLVRKLVTQEESTSAPTSCLFCTETYMKYWKAWSTNGQPRKTVLGNVLMSCRATDQWRHMARASELILTATTTHTILGGGGVCS